jgi:crotonobetainyl-CoA:carnitine CoA-transferase CaiB-like acyl-CoA transferase
MLPLEGVRVLDLTRLIPGLFASLVLADLGARVDKIEDAGAGDYLRHMPPQRGGASLSFHALNRGKRSAVLDLKNEQGRIAFERLLGSYDVLFEQFRPGVLARLGLAHDRLRELHPKLVICALTGYGQDGPSAARAGHDLNYLARAGVLAFQGPQDGASQVPGFQMADVSGALWSVIAILAALRRRDVSGVGEICDVAMSEGTLGFSTLGVVAALAGLPTPRGAETLTGGVAPYACYTSSDGVTVTLGSLEPKFWMTFCAAVGIDADPTALVPGPHQDEFKRRLRDIFAAKTADEWRAIAKAHDCCLEVALTPAQIADDEHLKARGMFFEIESQGESMPQFRTPVTPRGGSFTPAPGKGAHTREVLGDAGFSGEEIDELLANGAAVASAP